MNNRQMKTSVLLRRFAPYFKPYAAIMLIDLVCAALTTVCELVLPLIVRFLTNRGTGGAIGLTVPLILRVGLLYLVLRIVDASANYFMQSIGHVMGARIETDMRRDLFDHLQRLSYTFYDSNKIGQIMARITSDLFDVTEFAHHCPEEFFIAGLKIVVSFAILSNYSLTLTLIIFAIIPLMLLSTIYFNRRMRRAFKKSRNQTGEINAQVEDSLLGVRVVKSFANEELEKEKFDEGNQAFLEIKKEQYRYMAGFNSTTRIYDGVMYLAVMVIGGLFMTYGKITAADFIAYLLYVTTLLASVRRIVEFTEQFQRGMTGIERFIEVIDAPVRAGRVPLCGRPCPCACGHQPDGQTRGKRRAGRAFGQWQNHPLQPDPAVLRRDQRTHPDRRAGHPLPHPPLPPAADRGGTAGCLPVCRVGL